MNRSTGDGRRKGGGIEGRQREKEGSQGWMEGEGKDVVGEQKEGKEESEIQVGV
jgi:hypothetical protein